MSALSVQDVMDETLDLYFVSDASGKAVSVIVPIEVWRELMSERETAYLLKSETMKKRLLEAKNRQGGLSLEEVRAKLGI
jgi:antitoxin YefM